MLNTTTLTPAYAPVRLAAAHPAAPAPTMSAPKSAAQGTTVSALGGTRVFIGLDGNDGNAPGSPPRQAPV